MNCYLFDDSKIVTKLLPLTFLRPTSYIRIGIWSIFEKWKRWLPNNKIETLTSEEGFSSNSLFINGAVCPNKELVDSILNLENNNSLFFGETLIACKLKDKNITETARVDFKGRCNIIDRPWKIFHLNAEELISDFNIVTKGRKSEKVRDKNTAVYNEDNIFIEEGVTIKAATLDAENGPIYLGKNSTVNAGAVINGSFALLENSTVGMGAKMRGDSTVGPWSKVSGELTNSVIFGYSNKGHEGYMGNSVLAEWCNIGADSNTSNMKNDYSEIRLWDYESRRFLHTGLQFCGLIMGDHSKCGINTMFNSGTSVGVGCNLFGAGYLKNFIPSFTKGGPERYMEARESEVLKVAEIVMQRRGVILSDGEKERISKIKLIE